MERRSQLELYALLVCFGMLICFLVALYYLGYWTIAHEVPEYTINRWAYESHQTNERYWQRANFSERRPRPPELVLTVERERSWQNELHIERLDGARGVRLAGLGLVASSVMFWVHWRIARRARREEPGVMGAKIQRPLLLAVVTVFGFSCSFCTGLGGALMFSTLDNYSARYQEESRAVAPLLADPAFADVKISMHSSGGITLSGVVPTEADSERLRAQVTKALGERRSQEVTGAVQARVTASSSVQ